MRKIVEKIRLFLTRKKCILCEEYMYYNDPEITEVYKRRSSLEGGNSYWKQYLVHPWCAQILLERRGGYINHDPEEKAKTKIFELIEERKNKYKEENKNGS